MKQLSTRHQAAMELPLISRPWAKTTIYNKIQFWPNLSLRNHINSHHHHTDTQTSKKLSVVLFQK